MQDYVEYAIQTSRDRRKYMKEASDNKNEENWPPLKLNFNGGQFSSFLLYKASFMYFRKSNLFWMADSTLSCIQKASHLRMPGD